MTIHALTPGNLALGTIGGTIILASVLFYYEAYATPKASPVYPTIPIWLMSLTTFYIVSLAGLEAYYSLLYLYGKTTVFPSNQPSLVQAGIGAVLLSLIPLICWPWRQKPKSVSDRKVRRAPDNYQGPGPSASDREITRPISGQRAPVRANSSPPITVSRAETLLVDSILDALEHRSHSK